MHLILYFLSLYYAIAQIIAEQSSTKNMLFYLLFFMCYATGSEVDKQNKTRVIKQNKKHQ